MKQSKIEHVVAEMQAEKKIVDQCIAMVEGEADEAIQILTRHSSVIGACIARLSGNGTETPKPARTRKSRKASEATI